MTPWDRIDQELQARKRNWKWLADQLVMPPQTINHWKTRGVPAKYYVQIENVFLKDRGWVLDGDEAAPRQFSEMAKDIATLFDMIPRAELVKRSRAYNAAFEAIRRELPALDASD